MTENERPQSTDAAGGRHCCDDMWREVERSCQLHLGPYDCPDCLIRYSPKFREYGLIIHDGGTSVSAIRFCPWCGVKLPDSLRDRWAAELEALGVDPLGQEIPQSFQTDAWHRRSKH